MEPRSIWAKPRNIRIIGSCARREFDFAILILTPDDLLTSREETSPAPRDNVLFELGLFVGGLGRERTFIVYDRTAPPKLPSDLAGISAATFEPHSSGNFQSALGATSTRIEDQIERLGLRDRQRLKNISDAQERQVTLLEEIRDSLRVTVYDAGSEEKNNVE